VNAELDCPQEDLGLQTRYQDSQLQRHQNLALIAAGFGMIAEAVEMIAEAVGMIAEQVDVPAEAEMLVEV